MDYTDFTVEELASDESFQVFAMYGHGQAFWEAWKQAHPEKQGVFEEAAKLVRMAQLSQQGLPTHRGNPAGIKARLQAHVQNTPQAQPRRVLIWPVVYRAAAAVALMIVAGNLSAVSDPLDVATSVITSLSQDQTAPQWLVFPNPVPAGHFLHLMPTDVANSRSTPNPHLFDALGKVYPVVWQRAGEGWKTNVRHLPAGFYWVMLENGHHQPRAFKFFID